MFEPQFHITAHLLKTIEEIAAFREKILAATIQVPWISTLQRDSRVRNTHCSTAIEGNPLTEADVRALAEGKDLPTATLRAKKEVLNYFAALRFIEKNVGKKKLTHRDVRKLHALLARDVMDQGDMGRYRNIAVRVGNYVPPSAQQVSRLMSELLEWWNQASHEWSPVISSAIIHHQFESIHPFGDGNGRCGRALALWELYRRGFDTHHIFSVDEVYWEMRPRYYQALDAVRHQANDLSSWLEFSTEALHLTLERVWQRIQSLGTLVAAQKIILRPKQEKLLTLLREQGAMAPKEIWDALDISKQGAMDLIRPLLQAGIIKKVGTKKTGKYVLI